MKTKKIANHLKLGFLLFGISLLLWNCEKEKDFPIDQSSTFTVVNNIQKAFKEEFNAKAFPFLKEPLWDKITESIFNAEEYFEIPFENLEGIDFQKSIMITTHKLVVKKAEDKLKLYIVFFAMPNENGTIIDHISLDNLALKNAYISFFDLNRNNLESHRIKKGSIYKGDFKIKPIDGNNKQFARFPEENEDCQEVTIDRYERTCWGREIGIEFCTGWSYQFSYTMSSCDNPTGGPSYVNVEPECPEPGYKKDENGDCVPQIKNNLTGKANCSYEKLLSTGVRNLHNMVTELFIEFGENNIGGSNLTFNMSTDLPSNVGGRTESDGDGNYSIYFNENIMDDLAPIEIAGILIHEIAHAFLGKHFNDSTSSFSILYRKYINETGIKNYSHDIMKDQFINRMAIVLKNFDNSLFSSFDDYKILASQGVFELTPAQATHLTKVKKSARENDKSCEKK